MATLLVYGDWLLKRQHFKYLDHENKNQKLKCGGIVGFYKALNYLVIHYRPERVVIAWDGFDVSQKYSIHTPWFLEKKKEIENLKQLIKLGDLSANDSKKEHELEIVRQKIKLQRLLEDSFVRQMQTSTAEASDLIAEYTKQASEELEKVIIFSREQEFYQLIGEYVSVLLPKGMELITLENFTEKVGYHISNQLMIRCFLGDEKGFVEGIKRMSVKQLLKYFPELSKDAIKYSQLCSMAEAKNNEHPLKIYESIMGAKEVLARNSRVLNLKEPHLIDEDLQEINRMLHLPLSNDREIENVIEYFQVDGYDKYVEEDIKDFFSAFYSLMVNESEYRKIYNTL